MIPEWRLYIANSHVGAANGFYLEKLISQGQIVKYIVQSVKHVHNLQKAAFVMTMYE